MLLFSVRLTGTLCVLSIPLRTYKFQQTCNIRAHETVASKASLSGKLNSIVREGKDHAGN